MQEQAISLYSYCSQTAYQTIQSLTSRKLLAHQKPPSVVSMKQPTLIDTTTLDTSQPFDFSQFDIVVNVESLAEMPRQSVQFYLNSISTTLQKHSLFYSNNRLARLHEDAENLIDSTFFTSNCFLEYFHPSRYICSSRYRNSGTTSWI